jgi:hypothetical protein
MTTAKNTSAAAVATATDFSTPKAFVEPKFAYQLRQLKTEVIDITPETAAYWIEHRAKPNCRHSDARIKKYAKLMEDGLFLTTHQGIAFDWDGKIHDGYHRLHAIVKYGQPLKMMVTFGLDPDSFRALDMGFTRTPGHMLRLEGVDKNPDALAGGIRLFLRYTEALEKNEISGAGATTTEMVLAFHEQNPDFAELGQEFMIMSYRWQKFISASVGLSFTYMAIKKRHPQALLISFLKGLGTGEDLSTGSPILALRNRLTNARDTTTLNVKPEEVLAMTIRSYNAWMRKRAMKTVQGVGQGKKMVEGQSSLTPEEIAKYPSVLRYDAKIHRQIPV